MATRGDHRDHGGAGAVLDTGLARLAGQGVRWVEHDWLAELCAVAYVVAAPDAPLDGVAARRFLRALTARYGALGYVVGLRADGPGVPVVCYHVVGLCHALDELYMAAPLAVSPPSCHAGQETTP